MRLCATLALLCGLISASAADSVAEGWVAPLAPPLRLTGTFGEHRTGHLHTGIDLSTGGTPGAPVRAVAAGSVVRLRAGARGYGKALYLATAGGWVAVYGHLERFAPILETFLRTRQVAQGEYEIDLNLPPATFRFAAGETLAWSGESGAGPPHLHFELRRGERPQNPLLLGITATDQEAPQIEALCLHALAPDAWVAGGVGCPAGDPREAIPVWGACGVEARIIDRCGVTDARLAPLEIELWLDGVRLHARRFAQLDFARGHEVGRVYGTLGVGEGPWAYRLFRAPPGSDPDLVELPGGDGILRITDPAEALHILEIVARDAAGHVGRRTLRLRAQPPCLPIVWQAQQAREGDWEVCVQCADPGAAGCGPLRLEAIDRPETILTLEASPDGRHRTRGLTRGRWVLTDCDGTPVLPPLAIGLPEGGAVGHPAMTALGHAPWLSFGEGFVLLELELQPPPEVIPRAWLEGSDGRFLSLAFRGRGPHEGWLFALAPGGLRGTALRLFVDLGPRSATLMSGPLSLIGFDGSAGGAQAHGREEIACPGGRLTLAAEAATFYGPALLGARLIDPADSLWATVVGRSGSVVPEPDAPWGVLPVLSALLRLEPEGYPLRGPLWVGLASNPGGGATPPGAQARWGLYRRESDGRWAWVGREARAGQWGAGVERAGWYLLCADTLAPRIEAPVPAEGARLRQRPARLQVCVREIGSGFAPQDADLWLDGRPLLAAWDIDREELSAWVPDTLAPGVHRWEARVIDRVGNVGSRAGAFFWEPE